ncbi:MAG TPA: B12-binding domain-containing protein, partial [Cyclobacteriaceae bacterium]|nr:B12-binding domain-containing protein [Cyclobacteriaceae bacterium]
AHTIRIWEKRYHVIEPERTATNIRFYSDEDLKKIINVSLLNSHGHKISKIASLSNDQISAQINALSESKTQVDIPIDQLVVSMLDLDEEQFEKVLAQHILNHGFEKTITGIVYPFLEKIGVLWQTGSITPAHEHFITNLIRQKLITSIAGLPLPSKNALCVTLFLPEGELHEMGLLFAHYLTRKSGFKTFYLGQSVPHDDLKKIQLVLRSRLLITSLTSTPAPQQLEHYLNTLSTDFPQSTILASGYMLRNTAFLLPKNIKVFDKALELPALLTSFS